MFFLILSRANGNTDPFYLRFTTSKQENLILGTSRSAQGLQPKEFNKILGKKFYNFSFTVVDSPYGPIYLNAIKKKLKENSKESIFILSVDPWSISSDTKDPNDYMKFQENDKCLGNTYFVNIKPNFNYLIQNMNGNYYKLIKNKRNEMFLHEDGWLEVDVPMDTLSLNKRLKDKVRQYQNINSCKNNFSSLRLFYLKKTITFLKKFGKVYLVRLPIHSKIFEIEQKYMPDFTEKINSISKFSDGYLDMTIGNEKYIYIDGNHIFKKSGVIVSKNIANWINDCHN